MIDTLSKCNNLIISLLPTYICKALPPQTITQEHCFSCMRDSFRSPGKDTYDCMIKLCQYTINFGPIYVSEIYHFLTQSKILENNFLQLNRPINIMSLGCGIGVDYMALKKYIFSNELDIEFEYKGYDIEPLWQEITSDTIPNVPIIKDIINGFDCDTTDIIFMNKVFSTLKNHGLHTDFLSTFRDEIENLPVGSFIVFNDVNRFNMGRDDFDNFAQENSLQVIEKYFFNVENAYSDNYTSIASTHNICNIPSNLIHAPKPTVNKTVFFLYKKV